MTRITNSSFNTRAHVITDIRRNENVHPYWGLRQAEEYIRDRSAALAEAEFSGRKAEREWQRLQLKINELEALEILTPEQQLDLEEYQDQQAQIKKSTQTEAPMIRDCNMELAAAHQERSRILNEYPMFILLDFDGLQHEVVHEALAAKEATFIAGRVLASRQQLPESVSEALIMALPQERVALMQRVIQLLESASTNLAMQQLSCALSELSEEDRQQFITQAFSLMRQKQLEAVNDEPT